MFVHRCVQTRAHVRVNRRGLALPLRVSSHSRHVRLQKCGRQRVCLAAQSLSQTDGVDGLETHWALRFCRTTRGERGGWSRVGANVRDAGQRGSQLYSYGVSRGGLNLEKSFDFFKLRLLPGHLLNRTGGLGRLLSVQVTVYHQFGLRAFIRDPGSSSAALVSCHRPCRCHCLCLCLVHPPSPLWALLPSSSSCDSCSSKPNTN